MKTQQIVSLGIGLLVAALLAIVFTSARNRNVSQVGASTERNRVMPSFPVNQITSVVMKDAKGSLTLEKKESGWVVAERAGYPADFKKLGEFLRTMYDLASVQKVEVGPSKFSRVGLLDPADKAAGEGQSATVVTFKKEKGEEVGSLWVGKEYKKEERSQFGTFDSTAGRYVRRGGSDEVYLVAEELREATIEPKDWINKDFFKVAKVKSISRTVADAAKSWKLTRESDTADFTLVDAKKGEELDAAKVSSMKSAFSSPSFEDVLTGDKVPKPSEATILVETFDGFRYETKFGPKNDLGEYDMTVSVSGEFSTTRKAPEGEKEEDKKKADEEFSKNLETLKKQLAAEKKLAGHVYHVRGFVVDSLNKDRADLMKSDEPAATPDGPAAEGAAANPGLPGLDMPLPALGGN
ncbi:MAG: DUF4340 domain-containing protein [Verrucomicrobia bacterium]|nr:DUF4340 domain-containing protein [Verrucomicrobiota bacterium]